MTVKLAIPYYGGKQRIASKILPYLPSHTVYCEPFAGGLAVMMAKGMPKITSAHHYREVINDKNDQLINMWRQLQQSSDLHRRLDCTLYSQAEHDRAKDICKNGCDDQVEQAWAFFVSLSMSFGRILNNGFGYGVITRNCPSAFYNKVNNIKTLRNRLAYTYIFNEDALRIIERFDSPQTCFYCDPPYPKVDQGHYTGYTIDDYQRLIDALRDCQGSFVLSCYAQGIEPEEWQQVDFDAYSSASGEGKVGKNRDKSKKASKASMGNRKRTESLWVVDRSKNARDSLKPHLWTPSSGYPYRTQGLFKCD
jgi:DNA adenine methylase